MNFGIIFLVFGLQVVLALIVAAFLKKTLDKELIETALEQFEVLKSQEDSTQLKTIEVISHAILSEENRSRFKKIAARRFKDVALNFSTDAEFKGGLKVVVGDRVIDCTLVDRLQKLFNSR